MKPDKVRAFLQAIGSKVPAGQHRAGWIVSDCPLGKWRHEKGKSSPEVFGVRREQGDARSNCFSCGWHGSLSDLLMEMRMLNKHKPMMKAEWAKAEAMIEEADADLELNLDLPDLEAVLFGPREGLHEYPEWWLKSFVPVADVGWARDYLGDRDVTPDMATLLDLRADTKEKRICFPVRDFDGLLVGLHGRATVADTEPRYRMYTHDKVNNPIVWLGEHWIDLSRPVVVVEGPFDLASVRRVYDNVTSPLFVNPSFEKIKRMSDALEWITLYDRGSAGDAGRKRVTSFLHKDHVITHLQPPSGRKDPGECSAEELSELLSPIVQLIANNAGRPKLMA
jgi:hypothetical protein